MANRRATSSNVPQQNFRQLVRRLPLIPGLALLLTGCFGETVVLKQVDEFQSSVRAGAEATMLYFKEVNTQNRRLYYMLLSLYPACVAGSQLDTSCGAFGSEPGDSPLKIAQIPEDSLNARISLLNALASYAKALGDLASDSSPENFAKGIQEVETNFGSLNAQFEKLTGRTSAIDSNIDTKYITPISTIVKILGSEYLASRKWSAVRTAILQGKPQVEVLLTSLERDLTVANYIVPVNERRARSNLISYYNANRGKLTLDQRKSLLSDIEKARINFEAFAANDPAEVIKLMRKAHDKLVALAADGGTPKSIGELKAVLDLYIDRILAFRNAVAIITSNSPRYQP